MCKGTIKDYNEARGYGIITDTETGREYTVYANYILRKEGDLLPRGRKVEYDIENSRHQNWAVNVRVL